MSRFEHTLEEHGLTLRRAPLRVLQVNVGKLCNQACQHCHVDAGPRRTEIMTRETVDDVLAAIRRCGITTVDITGGAPELNPHFEHLVAEARALQPPVYAHQYADQPLRPFPAADGKA